MAFANGRAPASALGRVPGNGRLRRDAAAAYVALDSAVPASMALYDGSVGRTYRTLAMQYLAKRVHGRNAATPGTSNHGLGLAVDLMTRAQRAAVDRRGAAYGWAKRWSDASWEWWHLRWRPGVWRGRPAPVVSPLAVLTAEERRWVRELAALRAAARRGGWRGRRRRGRSLKRALMRRIKALRRLDQSEYNRRARLRVLRRALKA